MERMDQCDTTFSYIIYDIQANSSVTSQENDFFYLPICLDVDHVVVGSLQEYLVQTNGMKSFLVFFSFKKSALI